MKFMPTVKITKAEIAKLFPKRRLDSNKGDYGRVLVIAGSRGMTGAAVLAARAALKSGAGLVTLAVPESSQPIVAAGLPEAITLPLPETKTGAISSRAIKTVLDWKSKRGADAMLIGPGLGTDKDTVKFVVAVIQKLGIPFVIDADALNCAVLIGDLEKLFAGAPPHIMTPHPGEISRLLKIVIPRFAFVRKNAANSLSRLCGGVIVLKGFRTLVVSGENCAINFTGGPALAKAGTGDVLSGLTAGFWAQLGKPSGYAGTAFSAAKAGVYIHGLCGDMAAKELGERSVLAGELLDYLPRAMKLIGN